MSQGRREKFTFFFGKVRINAVFFWYFVILGGYLGIYDEWHWMWDHFHARGKGWGAHEDL